MNTTFMYLFVICVHVYVSMKEFEENWQYSDEELQNYEIEKQKVTKKLIFADEKVVENHLMSPKTKTQITFCDFGSSEDLHHIIKYENIIGGKAVFDARNQILRIVGKSAFGDDQIIYDINAIRYTEGALVALTNENRILTFGLESYGGNGLELEIEDVLDVASTSRAFAAFTEKGKVYVWGDQEFGGNIDGLDLQNILYVVGTINAFAALNIHGRVTTWSSKFKSTPVAKYVEYLINIVTLTSIDQSFAALDKDNNVFTWSASHTGSLMTEKFENVKKLISNGKEFGALTNDGIFFYWGNKLQDRIRQDGVVDIRVKSDRSHVFEFKLKNKIYRL